VPWLFLHAATSIHRGSDLDAVIRRRLIQLAIRLKQGERYGVIGGDKLGELTSQPPDRVYWTALRQWGLLLSSVGSRSEAIRRLRTSVRPPLLDDDGSRLDDDATEVFCNLPAPPHGWDNPELKLDFNLRPREQAFLRGKLSLLTRPGEPAQSLLARLVESRDSYPGNAPGLPAELDARADEPDQRALRIARDAANLAAIGRTVYGALVEFLREEDDGPVETTFRSRLPSHFDAYGQAAAVAISMGWRSFSQYPGLCPRRPS